MCWILTFLLFILSEVQQQPQPHHQQQQQQQQPQNLSNGAAYNNGNQSNVGQGMYSMPPPQYIMPSGHTDSGIQSLVNNKFFQPSRAPPPQAANACAYQSMGYSHFQVIIVIIFLSKYSLEIWQFKLKSDELQLQMPPYGYHYPPTPVQQWRSSSSQQEVARA